MSSRELKQHCYDCRSMSQYVSGLVLEALLLDWVSEETEALCLMPSFKVVKAFKQLI